MTENTEAAEQTISIGDIVTIIPKSPRLVVIGYDEEEDVVRLLNFDQQGAPHIIDVPREVVEGYTPPEVRSFRLPTKIDALAGIRPRRGNPWK